MLIFVKTAMNPIEMSEKDAVEYFSKLLNQEINSNSILKLSSAQKARAFVWLTKYKLNTEILSYKLGFKIEDIYKSLNIIDDNIISDKKIKTNAINTIGIDIQNIDEMFPDGFPIDPKLDIDLQNIFTIKELSYAQAQPLPQQTLAGIFAAKEAIKKCNNNYNNLKEIEVIPNIYGVPEFIDFHISISHSRDYAVAVAISKNINTKEHKKNELQNENILNNNVSNEIKKIKILINIIILLIALLIFTRF